jgi:nitrogen fixation/metabolism regulation signal transduction histidine kinase
VICLAAWGSGVRRVEVELELEKLMPDAVVGKDYRRILHDVKCPLAAIRMSADVISMRGDQELVQIGTEIKQCSEKINKLIESVNALELVQEIDLEDAIQEGIFLYGCGTPVMSSVVSGTKIACIPVYLDRLIGNIISNAVRHRTPGSDVVVKPVSKNGKGFVVTNEVNYRVGCKDAGKGEGLGIIKASAWKLGARVRSSCCKRDGGWWYRVEVTW